MAGKKAAGVYILGLLARYWLGVTPVIFFEQGTEIFGILIPYLDTDRVDFHVCILQQVFGARHAVGVR